MTAEWHDRTAFAEIAEALETNTQYIFAARLEKGRWFILYTPNYEDGDATMYSAWLKRDTEGILRLDAVKRAHPGMSERIEQALTEFMEGRQEDG